MDNIIQQEPEIVEYEISVDTCGKLSYKMADSYMKCIDLAIRCPDFIGLKKDGWIWGCLYRKKTDGSVYTFIDAESIDEFEVITPKNGQALFRR